MARYLYRIIFCADGNYSLQKKTKHGDPNNIALSTGQGFFIAHSKMYADLDKKYHKKGKGKGEEEAAKGEKGKGKGTQEDVNGDIVSTLFHRRSRMF